MARARSATPPLRWDHPRFAGKTFALAGQFSRYDREHLHALITADGGAIVADVDDQPDYLVVGRVAGKSTQAQKKAEKLRQAGQAAIQELSHDAMRQRLAPDRALAEAIFRGGEKAVARWQLLRRGPRAVVDLRGADLRGVDLRPFWLWAVDFQGADLSKTDLSEADLKQAKLTKATLTGADLSKATLAGADLSQADLRGAILVEADLSGACVDGADFTGANLDGVKWHNAEFDEKTVWPAGFAPPRELHWKGKDADPRFKQPAAKPAVAPPAPALTWSEFMDRLLGVVDRGRLGNALSMLKAERFQLFSQVEGDKLVGVIRSQSSAERVYACKLTADGGFSCGTQNLRVCGGLGGAICKHLLVLIVGLARGGQVDLGRTAQWVQASRVQRPLFDKDEAATVFLRHKGAEAGEIDWRPTETIPEDYHVL